jgi:hypothetical protein
MNHGPFVDPAEERDSNALSIASRQVILVLAVMARMINYQGTTVNWSFH